MVELTEGDFLYQSDQEIFLVVADESDDSYTFAVHGWRHIDKGRIDEYIQDSRSKVHQQEDMEGVIMDEADESAQKEFNKLKQLFSVYEQEELSGESIPDEFGLDDT